MSRRSVQYTSSPLLASRTPVWRSKFVVGAIALAFLGLAGRAAYIQVVGNDFFQRQGAVRFSRTLELPANRGRILDRNGLLLASSVVAQSIWAIPEDVERDAKQLQRLARLLRRQRFLDTLGRVRVADEVHFVDLRDPRELDPSGCGRIPIRTNRDDRYFTAQSVDVVSEDVEHRALVGMATDEPLPWRM